MVMILTQIQPMPAYTASTRVSKCEESGARERGRTHDARAAVRQAQEEARGDARANADDAEASPDALDGRPTALELCGKGGRQHKEEEARRRGRRRRRTLLIAEIVQALCVVVLVRLLRFCSCGVVVRHEVEG